MFHLVAYYLSIADATLTQLTAVADNIMQVSNNNIRPQDRRQIVWAAAIGPSLLRAQLITPDTRQFTNPFIRPTIDDTVRANPLQVADYRSNPFQVKAREEIRVDAIQDSGGAAICQALLGLASGPLRPVPAGDVYTMRGTGTGTLVAGSWTQATITWPDNLPSGRYACVGMEAISANLRGARLIFEDQVERPGSVGLEDVNQQAPSMFRKGGLGVWGEFQHDRMPNIEFLAAAADTAEEVYLDFVRIG